MAGLTTNTFIKANGAPEGYTNPSETEVAGGDYTAIEYTTTIAKSVVQDADPVVTWGNLRTEADSQLTTKLNGDFAVATKNVDASYKINVVDLSSTDTNAPENYTLKGLVKIAVTA